MGKSCKRLLASREGNADDRDKTLSLYVSHVEHGVASICIIEQHASKSDIDHSSYITQLFSNLETNEHSIVLDKPVRIEDEKSNYLYGTVSLALDWVETKGFVVDMFVLAELVRALEE